MGLGWGIFFPPCLSSFDLFYICELCIPREEEKGATASSAQELGNRRTRWIALGWDTRKSQEPAQFVPVAPQWCHQDTSGAVRAPSQCQTGRAPVPCGIFNLPRAKRPKSGQNPVMIYSSLLYSLGFYWDFLGGFSRRVCNFSFPFPVLPACVKDGLSTPW